MRYIVIIFLLASVSSASAQTSTVVNLGTVPASQIVSGLGFNVTLGSQFSFQLASQAGATWGRFQCDWLSTENQTAPPNNNPGSPQYTMPSTCTQALTWCTTYGLKPTIVAGYGSPWHDILQFYAPNGASSGATSFEIQFASGVGGDTFANIAPFTDDIANLSGGLITNIGSSAGGMITAVTPIDSTHATITLASGLSGNLPANTSTAYRIRENLYPPSLTNSATDQGVVAFTNYVKYIAGQVGSAGLTGQIELWNEPPWSGDPWDNRGDFYDSWPGDQMPGPRAFTYAANGQNLPNAGFVAALQSTTPPSGVTYNWAGTEKSGFNDPLFLMPTETAVSFTQPSTAMTTESLHPYGNNPEDNMWSGACLATHLTGSYSSCLLVSTSTTNYPQPRQNTLNIRSTSPNNGININVTETGYSTNGSDTAHQARWVIRQFLELQAAGLTPVDFYTLYDNGGQGFGFVDPSTHVALPSYTAIAGLIADAKLIGGAVIGSPSVPTVSSYTGTYQLNTVSLTGSRSGAASSSILFALWQQSYTTGTWGTLVQPTAVATTVALPSGLNATQVVNLDTRASVSFTQSGQSITFNLSDDPIEILADPPGAVTGSMGGTAVIGGNASQ